MKQKTILFYLSCVIIILSACSKNEDLKPNPRYKSPYQASNDDGDESDSTGKTNLIYIFKKPSIQENEGDPATPSTSNGFKPGNDK